MGGAGGVEHLPWRALEEVGDEECFQLEAHGHVPQRIGMLWLQSVLTALSTIVYL